LSKISAIRFCSGSGGKFIVNFEISEILIEGYDSFGISLEGGFFQTTFEDI
jgi:hypothetical protein